MRLLQYQFFSVQPREKACGPPKLRADLFHIHNPMYRDTMSFMISEVPA
jgi:hypothetical protein